MKSKLDYLKDNEDYNTLVIGSSYIYRHFIPSHFDSITGNCSFNLGAPGIRYMEGSYILENLLNEDDKYLASIDNILFLTQMNVTIPDNHLHTVNGFYWMDKKRFVFGLNLFYNNFEELRKYTISFIENVFLYQMRSNLIRSFYSTKDCRFDYDSTKGYLNLDDEPEAKFRNKYFKRRFTDEYRSGYSYSYVYSPENEILSKFESCFERNIRLLEAKCYNKGIKLYSVFLSNNKLHHKLSVDNILYMGDGCEVPDLFRAENYFDKWHHNSKGAELFTDRLAFIYNSNAVSPIIDETH